MFSDSVVGGCLRQVSQARFQSFDKGFRCFYTSVCPPVGRWIGRLNEPATDQVSHSRPSRAPHKAASCQKRLVFLGDEYPASCNGRTHAQ